MCHNHFEHLLQCIDSVYIASCTPISTNSYIEYNLNNTLKQMRVMIGSNRRGHKPGIVKVHKAVSLEHYRALQLADSLNTMTRNPDSTDRDIEILRNQLCEQLRVMIQQTRRDAVKYMPYNPIENTKILAKKKLEETVDCSICQESPKIKDCILTECNHYFCRGCWDNWMNAVRSNKDCPNCRTIMPEITGFKSRCYKSPRIM